VKTQLFVLHSGLLSGTSLYPRFFCPIAGRAVLAVVRKTQVSLPSSPEKIMIAVGRTKVLLAGTA
jgi:hypothetical protein